MTERRQLFISGFDASMTDPEIRHILEPCGTVLDSFIQQRPGQAPFGILSMATSDEARAAKEALNAAGLTARWAASKTCLWVGGLGPTITNEILAQVFGGFGELVSAKVFASLGGGTSKGHGMVEYKDRNDAKAALELISRSHLVMGDSLKPLQVAYADFPESDDGFSEQMKGMLPFWKLHKKRKRGEVDGDPHLIDPASAEHIVADKFQRIQQEYKDAKAKLKAMVKAQEKQLEEEMAFAMQARRAQMQQQLAQQQFMVQAQAQAQQQYMAQARQQQEAQQQQKAQQMLMLAKQQAQQEQQQEEEQQAQQIVMQAQQQAQQQQMMAQQMMAQQLMQHSGLQLDAGLMASGMQLPMPHLVSSPFHMQGNAPGRHGNNNTNNTKKKKRKKNK